VSRRFPVRIHECADADGNLQRGCHCKGYTDATGAAVYVATGDYCWHERKGTVWHAAIVCQTGRTRSTASAPKGGAQIAPTETQHSNRVPSPYYIVDNSNRVDPEHWNRLLVDAGLSVSRGEFLTKAPQGRGRLETGGYSSAKASEMLGKREEQTSGYKVEPSGSALIGDEREDKRSGNYDEEEAEQSRISTVVGVEKILKTSCTVCGEFVLRQMFLPYELGRARVEQTCACRNCITPRKRDHYGFGWLNPENDFVWNEKMESLVQVPQSDHRTPNMMTVEETWKETRRLAQEAKRKRTTAYSIES
jgi:hypothetical protein